MARLAAASIALQGHPQATIRGHNTTFIPMGNLQPPLGFSFA